MLFDDFYIINFETLNKEIKKLPQKQREMGWGGGRFYSTTGK